MELPDPRRSRLIRPRPSLVNDFFAPHARPRSLSGAPAPTLLHPGSRLTGRPLLDTPPIGTRKTVRPDFLVVELHDGRPGLIAVADLTRVWTRPRGIPHLPATPSLWDRFLTAIAPKAGFILYAPGSVLSRAEDPNQYLRHGIVYDAIDVGLLKQTMDSSGAGWVHPAEGLGWLNQLLNAVKYVKNSLGLHDAIVAGGVVKERIAGTPKVKLVVYSGHKTRMSQVDSLDYVLGKTQQSDGAGDGHFIKMNRGDGLYDSAYQENHYLHGRLVSRHTFLPR